MKQEAFELGENLKLRNVKYKLYPVLWDKWDLDLDLEFSSWTVIKYLNYDGTDFSDEINQVPKSSGGLYLFFIKCKTISGLTEFPLYIGRAQYSNHQNLRKRVREYFTTFFRNDERPKITRMFKYWAPELFLAFKIVDENDEIIDLEKRIINSLLLPMNDKIPDTITSQAIKAFE